jgi:TolB-like protein
MSRTVLVTLALAVLPSCRLAALQCPDGAPPPCRGARTAAAPSPNSVAVLYFDNLSRDTADAFLADGLTEEVIIRLGQVERLAVKSRFEVQRFRGAPTAQDPAILGRSLNAAYLVTGSVQRVGDRVRLRVALVRSATRAQVWGDVIDRSSSDLLTLESDIAREVTAAITGRLLPAERARLDRPLTRDPVAYQEYLRGVAMSSSMDEAPLRAGLEHFARAIARDSAFAAAWAGQADIWSVLADGYEVPLTGYRHAAEAARRALALDSSLTPSWVVLALATQSLDLDLREAARLARQAVARDPRSGEARIYLSSVLLGQGHLAEAVAEARAAWPLDSLNVSTSSLLADALIYGRSLDTLAAMLPRLRAVLPRADADNIEGRLRAARGDLSGAERLLDWRWYGGFGAGSYVRALLARGDTVAARATLDSMLARRRSGYFNPIAVTKTYLALGDLDRAFEWLQRAFDERTAWLVFLRVDDELAPLRADPRYAAFDRMMRY